MTTAAIFSWTGLLLVSLLPLLLGRDYFRPTWLQEVHMVAVAGVLLLAWNHRDDGRRIHSLRWGLLLCALVAAAWQTGTESPEFTPQVALGIASYLPPALAILACFGEPSPAPKPDADAGTTIPDLTVPGR